MDMIACKIAGRNSNTAMETVSFSLVSFDKVRFYIQHTDAYDAGSIDLLKMRIAVFMTVCSASTEQQQWSISRTSDVFYCRWDYQFPRSAAWLRIIRRFLLLVGAVLSHRGRYRSWFAKLVFCGWQIWSLLWCCSWWRDDITCSGTQVINVYVGARSFISWLGWITIMWGHDWVMYLVFEH